MDLAVLQVIARELNQTLPTGFINKIHQPLPRDIVLRIRPRSGGELRLMLSADPAMGRMHLTDLRIPNPPRPLRFCAYLRAHLQGARILEVQPDEHDRVVRIVASRGPADQRAELELIIELLGRDSNLILLDHGSNTILDCLHHLPEKETGSRVVLPGALYLAPPPRRVPLPTPGPLPARDRLPGIAAGPDGTRRLTVSAKGPNDEVFPSMNAAADAYYSPRLKASLIEAFRREIVLPLKARMRSLDRRVEKIHRDSSRLEQYRARSEEGELLKANLRQVKKGMTAIEVQDWTTGEPRTIGLDPALDAVANMERIFRLSAKGKRGIRKVEERLNETHAEKKALEDLLYFVESASDVDELENLVEATTDERKGKATATRSASGEHTGAESPLFRRFETAKGRTILVGKSGRGNAFMLRHKARKGDLWFHVKDYPGAHVLLLVREPGDVPAEEQRTAAELAVKFSRAGGKGKVDVIVADIADVHQIAGGIPGQVTVKTHRTIRCESE